MVNNGYSLVYIYNDFNHQSQHYQLKIKIDSIIYLDSKKIIYEIDNKIGIYDLSNDTFELLSTKLETVINGYIDKVTFYDNQLYFTLNNSDTKLYRYNLNTETLSIVTEKFINKLPCVFYCL